VEGGWRGKVELLASIAPSKYVIISRIWQREERKRGAWERERNGRRGCGREREEWKRRVWERERGVEEEGVGERERSGRGGRGEESAKDKWTDEEW
jgi:hypothetical protein